MSAQLTNDVSSHSSQMVLVVEDEELLLELVRSLLESQGYAVLTASDGETATELYRRSWDRIALVLTDLGLPKLSGWDAFRAMREVNPQVRVIVASGYLEPKVRDEMLAAGVDDFVQKPYSATEIIEKVRRVLGQTTNVSV